jgi:hypothetical protein
VCRNYHDKQAPVGRHKTRVGERAASGHGLPPGVILSEYRAQHLDYVVCAEGISFQSGPRGLRRRVKRTLLFAWNDIASLDLEAADSAAAEGGDAANSILRVRTKSGRTQPLRLSASVAQARDILYP